MNIMDCIYKDKFVFKVVTLMSWELFVKYKIHTHTSDAEATTIIITTIIIIITGKAMGMKHRTTSIDCQDKFCAPFTTFLQQ